MMKNLIRSAVALLAAVNLAFAAALPDETRQDLGKLVPECIRLLEAKDYVTLLETAVPPDEFKKLTERSPITEFAAKFGERKAASLLAVLKAIKDVKPTISEDGNTAKFAFEGVEGVSKKEIVFAKIEGRWFIKN